MPGSPESPSRDSSVVNRDLLAAKLAELSDRIARVRTHAPATLEALESNRDTLDLVAFNLMLSVQSCSDIASHLIADERWPAAASLAESFGRLEQHRVISPRTARALAHTVGLRNVVAHGYAGLDVRRCFEAAHTGLADLESFAREVSTWAQGQRSGSG